MATSYKSDYVRPSGSGGGRPFDTHGARFDNGMVFVNEGSSHEENPNGGVQVGVDGDGKPNLVEQGEVIVDLGGGPYVMSQRLRLSREDLLMAGLPVKYAGKTCAEAATGMQRESEERPLDEVSMRGLRAMLERLAAVQETYRDDIGASGTQNLNLGQDLYGARAQAVGNEEELGQPPMGTAGAVAAYGGWNLKRNDMTPYYFNQLGQPVAAYDGYCDIPPQNGGFNNGMVAVPQYGIPAAPRYPAAYPYPIAPVQRQMAYGGYRFALDDETFTLGTGEQLIKQKDGSYMYYKPGRAPRPFSSEEAANFMDRLEAEQAYNTQMAENARKANPIIGDRAVAIDATTNNPDQNTGRSEYEHDMEVERGANDFTGSSKKSNKTSTKEENNSNSRVDNFSTNNFNTYGNVAGYDSAGRPIFGQMLGKGAVGIDASANADGINGSTNSFNIQQYVDPTTLSQEARDQIAIDNARAALAKAEAEAARNKKAYGGRYSLGGRFN